MMEAVGFSSRGLQEGREEKDKTRWSKERDRGGPDYQIIQKD